MSERESTSWEDVVDRLRGAANDLRSAAGRSGPASPEEEAAAQRLKEDVSRLEQSAADLKAKLSSGFDAQREEFESSVDRERAEQAAGQLRASIDELISLTGVVATELKSAAESSFTHAQPELRSAIRTLEDVAGSAASWVKAIIDPERTKDTR